MQTCFFCFFAYQTRLGNSRPNSVLFCRLRIHVYLCKIDLNSCHSYSGRFTWSIIPIELTAMQGSTMSLFNPPVPQVKQLSCPLTHNNQRSITNTICKSRTDDKPHKDCDIWSKQDIQHTCALHGKKNTESQFCFSLFSQLPIFDLLDLLHADSKVLWGKL